MSEFTITCNACGSKDCTMTVYLSGAWDSGYGGNGRVECPKCENSYCIMEDEVYPEVE